MRYPVWEVVLMFWIIATCWVLWYAMTTPVVGR